MVCFLYVTLAYFDLRDDVIDVKYYLTLDKLIRRKIICYILEDIYKDELTVINDRHVNSLMRLLESKRANCKICLPRGCYVEKNYDSAHILKDAKAD